MGGFEISDVHRYREQLRSASGRFVFAPVRHHSPACAGHVRDLIREVAPKHVLIEAPADFEPLIDLLLDVDTVPPVAIAAFLDQEDGLRNASYYPFCAHSPEYVAMQTAREIGASIGFIDLPCSSRFMLHYGFGVPGGGEAPDQDGGEQEAGEEQGENEDSGETGGDDRPGQHEGPGSLLDERLLDASNYTKALAAQLGCRDGLEVWDHLFEWRLGKGDPSDFFADVGAYCLAVRMATPPRHIMFSEAPREAHMISCLAKKRRVRGKVLVLTGGFHTPALVDAVASKFADLDTPEPPEGATPAKHFLVRYGFHQLDALHGYGAGLPSPGYYDRVWSAFDGGECGEAFWQGASIDLFVDFAARQRETEPDRAISIPLLQSAIRSAADLSELRARAGPLRVDINDAALSTFVKGEASGAPQIDAFAKFLVGDRIGDIPARAGSPPLVEHTRKRAMGLKFDLTTSARRSLALDIYRRPQHLEVSRFLHLLSLINVDFGRLEAGPDFLHGGSSDLLFERWNWAWSPQVEASLIEQSALGDSLDQAGVNTIRAHLRQRAEIGSAREAAGAVKLFLTAMQAGLHGESGTLLSAIAGEIAAEPEFASVCEALRNLDLVWRAREVLGLTGSSEVGAVINRAYIRALYLIDTLGSSSEEHIAPRLDGLITLNEVVRASQGEIEGLDASLLTEALERLDGEVLPPVLAGGLAALLVTSNHREPAYINSLVSGNLKGAYVSAADKVGALYGVLKVAPELIRRVPGLIAAIDKVIGSVDDEDFIELLPHLRLAFATLNPGETEAVSASVAGLYSVGLADVASAAVGSLSESELKANLSFEARLKEALSGDGLSGWLADCDSPDDHREQG
ncbi:MAG: hypothetical protein K0U74_02240 [Alphaproteobacteria bacterium]|nr:hypothetical protein [Alphaproteobacteria bacterium]